MVWIGEVSSLESSSIHQLVELADNVKQCSFRLDIQEQLRGYFRSNPWLQSLCEKLLSFLNLPRSDCSVPKDSAILL